jgi:DNA modification methylase
VKLSEIRPNERNPRKISPEQLEKLKESISNDPEFMLLRPIVYDSSDSNKILGGNMRYRACLELGMDELPEGWTRDGAFLTPEKKRRFILVDNAPEGMSGEWDFELLAEDWEMPELGDLGFDLEAMGFDADEEIEGLTDDDDVPEVPVDPVSKRGDIWLCGDHRVMCGDSTSSEDVGRLMDGKKADMVFTDPPYGVDYDGGHAVKGKRREKLLNDATPDIYSPALLIAYSETKDNAALYLWFSDSRSSAVLSAVLSAGYEVRNTLIWNKNLAQFGAIGAQYKSKHEPCIYAFKRGKTPFWAGPTNEVSVWDVSRETKNDFHPTQKPVALSERAIKNSCPYKGIALDLFLGSGSTLIACEKTNRTCYGMEISGQYVDVIINRWQDFTGKQVVHAETGELFDDRR